MRRLLLFIWLSMLAAIPPVKAQVLTEAEVVETLMRSLGQKDPALYLDLFPRTDSIVGWVLQHADKTSEPYQRMQYLQANYYAKQDFDSSIRREATKGFEDFVRKGTTLGLHWDQLVFVRYELEKLRRGRDLISEKIADLRFVGYVFVKDMLTRKLYTFTVFDIMQVNGLWYGGELGNIFQTSTKEGFHVKLAAERKRLRLLAEGRADTTTTGEADSLSLAEGEEIKMPKRKEILDRKFYRGKFDNEISVQLYVRHIKGGCPEIICAWDALFKFGDQDEFVPMEVSRTPDGKWLFTEELGGMELVLNGEQYTGSYASSSDKTEYEVKFSEATISNKRLEAMDAQLDLGEVPEY